MKKAPVRIGIIGTGGMARQHAEAYSGNPHCALVAAVDVDLPKASAFAQIHHIQKTYSSVRDMLACPELDAVSVVVPDRYHSAISIECLKAGKHVLCEKPLAVSLREARQITRVAQASGLVNMVNFSFRSIPAIEAMRRVIASGRLGELRHVEGSFLQSWLTATLDGGWQASPALLWRLSSAHGSKGALGDVGVHLIDLLVYLAGPVSTICGRLKTFSKAPGDRIGEYMLDANDSASAMLEFASGAMGILHTTRWSAGNGNRISIRISGTEGSVEFDSDVSRDVYRISAGADRHTLRWRNIACRTVPTIYEKFVQAVRSGQNDTPSFADGTAVQALLDACFTGKVRTLHPDIPSLKSH